MTAEEKTGRQGERGKGKQWYIIKTEWEREYTDMLTPQCSDLEHN